MSITGCVGKSASEIFCDTWRYRKKALQMICKGKRGLMKYSYLQGVCRDWREFLCQDRDGFRSGADGSKKGAQEGKDALAPSCPALQSTRPGHHFEVRSFWLLN